MWAGFLSTFPGSSSYSPQPRLTLQIPTWPPKGHTCVSSPLRASAQLDRDPLPLQPLLPLTPESENVTQKHYPVYAGGQVEAVIKGDGLTMRNPLTHSYAEA